MMIGRGASSETQRLPCFSSPYTAPLCSPTILSSASPWGAVHQSLDVLEQLFAVLVGVAGEDDDHLVG